MLVLNVALISLAMSAQDRPWGPPRPPVSLHEVPLPILEFAKDDPEALWEFLVDPETPYLEARAAAVRCRPVFSLKLIRPLQRANWELHSEALLHGNGVADSPNHSRVPRHHKIQDLEQERRILGRAWTLPKELPPYPHTWAEEAKAPWPWRVKKIVNATWQTVVPRSDPGERTQAWLAECMSWPIADDNDAWTFVVASSAASHTSTLPVLARWRKILLDQRMPEAAKLLAQRLGQKHRLMVNGPPEARLACQLIAADVLRSSPHELAREACAYQLSSLGQVFGVEPGDAEATLPAEALIAAADLAMEVHLSPAERWRRTYYYAQWVIACIDDPTFSMDPRIDRESVEAQELPGKFKVWFETQRPVFQMQVDARADDIARLRARLIELEK